MTREEAREAVKEAYGNSEYTDEIIKALAESATVSDIQHRGRAHEAGVKDGLEQKPCEDAVSRKSVITIIQNHWWNCRDIDKLVNELPPVTPQEPFINKPCVSEKVCEHDKQMVLDEIRAEIVRKHLSIAEKNDFDNGRTYGYEEALEIIDKYKIESEV